MAQQKSASISSGESVVKAEKSTIDVEAQQPVTAPSPTAAGPTPPPNGGFKAWTQVASAFMLFFNTWGILNAFGVYQTYYEQGELFTASSSDISWVGSICAFMLLAMGMVAGPVFDRGYLKALLFVGTFMVVFGHMMLSLCHQYYQVLLAQGFVIGIGAGCLFVPCVAVLPGYFTTRLGAALGLAVMGSSLGGIIYPIVLYKLIGEVGFPWAVRVIGFIALATLLVPLCFMQLRVQPPRVRKMVDLSAFKDTSWLSFVFVSIIAFMGLFVIFFYLSFYAESERITSAAMAFYLVPIFNAGSCFGRTIPNIIADKSGPFNVLVPGTIVSGILMLCMIAVHSEGAIIVVAILSGFCSGVMIGIPPLCFVALTQDKSKLGTRMGMAYAIIGLGILIGGPGAGAILRPSGADGLDWQSVWIFGGVSTAVAGFGYLAIRVWKYGVGITKA